MLYNRFASPIGIDRRSLFQELVRRFCRIKYDDRCTENFKVDDVRT